VKDSRSLTRYSALSSEGLLAAWITNTLNIITGSSGGRSPSCPEAALPCVEPGRERVKDAAAGMDHGQGPTRHSVRGPVQAGLTKSGPYTEILTVPIPERIAPDSHAINATGIRLPPGP
jgi:hypothetical protein